MRLGTLLRFSAHKTTKPEGLIWIGYDRIRRNRSIQVGIRYDGISQDKTRQDRVRIFVGYDQIR